ncbi:MAG: PQQ-binding-like beta-propeller repeat protein [Phycisphaerae bacterium]|nr:PQQ-binding-like beta-propeller repeat protein [Phycisphaerae bacterium]
MITARISATCLLTAVVLGAFVAPSPAENWPVWRGPRGDGTSLETSVPRQWSATQNIKWKVPIPGKGHASPVVWGDRIFLVTATENERVLLCLDRLSGRILWNKTVLESPRERIHRLNSYASSTPATDGRHVFVSFLDEKQMFIAAYDFDGKQVWGRQPGVFSSVHGYCASPILWKDTLIINGDHDGKAYIVSLHKDSGKTAWKTMRPNRIRSYCTPLLRRIDGRNQMILSGSRSVASYDPDTGRQHWVIDGPTDQFVASLVYNGDLLFMTAGFPERHMMAIRPDGHGNVTKTHVAWHTRSGCSYVPSPIAAGPYFLVVDDRGKASCFKAATGDRLWYEKLGGRHSASLVSANGLVYFLADDGVMTVVRPGPKLNVIARNELGEACNASPAITQGQMLIRGDRHLFCIE